MRSSYVVGGLAIAMLCGAACVQVNPSTAGDASVGEAGSDGPSVDAGLDAATDRPSVCEPHAISTALFDFGHPQNRNECGWEVIPTLVKCDFGDPKTPLTVCQAGRVNPDWQRCADCLYGVDGGPPAPFISENGIVRMNVGGCLAIALNDSSGSGCPGDLYDAEKCLSDMCSDCVDAGPDGYEQCRALARAQNTCKRHATAECAAAADDAGCTVTYDFYNTATVFGRRFCAQPPVDAGDDG